MQSGTEVSRLSESQNLSKRVRDVESKASLENSLTLYTTGPPPTEVPLPDPSQTASICPRSSSGSTCSERDLRKRKNNELAQKSRAGCSPSRQCSSRRPDSNFVSGRREEKMIFLPSNDDEATMSRVLTLRSCSSIIILAPLFVFL